MQVIIQKMLKNYKLTIRKPRIKTNTDAPWLGVSEREWWQRSPVQSATLEALK